MCGIIGVLGGHEVAPVLVEALRRLEYRGYDSAGIATLNDGRLDRRRAVGKLVNLSDLLVHHPLPGKVGIGHTRWATHGAPTEANAHPHLAGPVTVVHNGIIENFRDLREEVLAAGHSLESQTDTETVAALTRLHLARGMTPRDAAKATIARLTGAFALLFLFEGEDDLLIAARRGSPLAIGHGEGETAGEMFVGSDAVALAPLTGRITYLEEGDIAFVTRAGIEVFDAGGAPVTRAETRIDTSAARVDKAGHRHFMDKEIAEQPVVIADALRHYLGVEGTALNLPAALNFAQTDRITLVACGTAHYACHVAKYWFEQFAGLPVEVDIASEFRYRNPPLSPRSMAIFVSQSGETADTLAALRYAKGRVAQVAAVVNVTTSSIAREADLALPILAGVEVGVASTKAFTSQLTVLALMALKAGRDRGRIDDATLDRHLQDLRSLPGLMTHALALGNTIAAIATHLATARDVLFLGRGALYPIALEGALKLKEISYIHAEGYASGELKHGPIALVDAAVPVVVLAPHDALFDKTTSNMHEVLARDGKVILVTDAAGAAAEAADVWRCIEMPVTPALLAPILYALPMQLLAYHTAVEKGTDVDQPRNLAKSVTVE
ncbi:MAG: glutamine--fructose-6-phosphate transaminase (isomerizing) [Rhodobacteraceae bacterium]|nr:glutamine--fructose-6-phosphate transaminase (isomerizing) [Paracoccaceae bacterium]